MTIHYTGYFDWVFALSTAEVLSGQCSMGFQLGAIAVSYYNIIACKLKKAVLTYAAVAIPIVTNLKAGKRS